MTLGYIQSVAAEQAIEILRKDLALMRVRVQEAEMALSLVPAYADYYAAVTAQGDAPETFDDWRNGAAMSVEEANVLRNKATEELNLYRREQSTRV